MDNNPSGIDVSPPLQPAADEDGGAPPEHQQRQNGSATPATTTTSSSSTTSNGSSSSSASSVFQQHFFHQQTNGGHVPPLSPAVIPQGFPPSAVQVSPMGLHHPNGTPGTFPGSNEAMQAFAAAAAANNLGLLCTPPAGGALAPFASSMPSSSFPLVNYGQRPPMAQQLAAVPRPLGGVSLRKNGPSSALGPPPPHCSSSSSSVPSSSSSTSSINRSQRCGVCRGCQCKPCGQCTYCQDSPQFGGPGVKKQSCIERRCLRVLENRLQRDAPTFKARIGCGACEDCRSADCQICLVCLDKRFFNGRYMCGALCAKKRCNNATSLELPCSLDKTSLKRPSSDQNGVVMQHHNHQQQMAKRQQLFHQQSSAAVLPNPNCPNNLNSNIARILSAAQHDGGRAGSGGGSFGRRSSGGNSTTNSPMSENGAASCHSADGATPPSAALPPGAPQMLFGRSLWPSAGGGPQPPHVLGMVPFGAHFDQQMAASLAVVAGFPASAHQQNFNGHSSNYYQQHSQPKFQSSTGAAYPKYEYFEESAVTSVAVNGGGGLVGAGREEVGAGTDPGGPNSHGNPFVPPSYSAEHKVVLQPL